MLQGQHFGGVHGIREISSSQTCPLPHGTGTFNLLYSPANRHRPEDSTFQPADRAEWSAVPVQITLTNKKAGKQCQSKSLILPGGRLESV